MKADLGKLGTFEWPSGDTKCLEHLQQRWTDAGRSLRYVKDFSVCVQAGGNVGVWPRYLKDKFQTVYTFEPDPINFLYLCRNVPEPSVVKLNAAVGVNNQLIKTSLTEAEIGNIGAFHVEQGGIIPTFTIDQLCLKSCGLIALDIEGYEYFALQGAMNTIHKYSPVIHIEDKGLSEKYDVKRGQAIELLKNIGYAVVETVARDYILCR